VITREKWLEVMGREPENDDLERANCPRAGEPGHFECGWDHEVDEPRFNPNSLKRMSVRRARAEHEDR
jgi:hypothetical protein